MVDNQPVPIPKPPRLLKENLIRIDDTTTPPPHPKNPTNLGGVAHVVFAYFFAMKRSWRSFDMSSTGIWDKESEYFKVLTKNKYQL